MCCENATSVWGTSKINSRQKGTLSRPFRIMIQGGRRGTLEAELWSRKRAAGGEGRGENEEET